MIVCTIHEPPESDADALDRAERLTFVRDGFSAIAAVFAPLWMLLRAMWLPLAGYVVAVVFLVGLALVAGGGVRWATLLVAALHLIIGFEASSIRRFALDRKGWRELGTVSGRTQEECERRFLDNWFRSQGMQDGNRLSSSRGGMAELAGSLGGFAGPARGMGRSRLSFWRS